MRNVDSEMIETLLLDAQKSERLRAFHVFHQDDEAFNRMLIAGVKGSYAAPHRHTTKFEIFTYVMGELTVIEFNDDGTIRNAYDLSKCPYVEVAPMTWHAVIFTSEKWAFMEMALWPHKYDPKDKEFAPWAPIEGDTATDSYVAKLKESARSHEN